MLVGLGNPWPAPARSRHNLGALVVESLAKKLGLDGRWTWYWGCCSWVCLAGPDMRGTGDAFAALVDPADGRLALVLPAVPYNYSGFAVSGVLASLGAGVDDLVVLQDDIDSAPCRGTAKRGGSHGGNRGVRSVQESLGTDDVRRLRLGVGRPPNGERGVLAVMSHVMGQLEDDVLDHWEQAAGDGTLVSLLVSAFGAAG